MDDLNSTQFDLLVRVLSCPSSEREASVVIGKYPRGC